MFKKAEKYRLLWIYLVLASATTFAFWQVQDCDFVNYDDRGYVSENRHVNRGFTRESIIWAFTTSHASNWHPVTWLSHMLDCQLFGTDAGWHHLINLLLHIINTLLLFAVLKQMTGAVWASGFVAACFALHPLHVESVAWIAERKDVLSTMFWMLTLLAYGHYVKRPAIGRYLLIMLAFALGLMAKPMLVTLPFVLLLLDYWPLGRLRFAAGEGIGRWRSLRGLIIEKIPLFLLSAVSSVITLLIEGRGVGASIDELAASARIINATVSYVKYIAKTIWPGRLAVFYPHPVGTVPIWHVTVAALLLLIISVWVIRLARSHRYLAVGWFWYLGTLVPVIGLVQVGSQAMADRYTYLPLIGLFIIVAWGAAEISAKWHFRKVVPAAASSILLIVLLICTRMQIRHWRNDLTLFQHAIEVTEDNALMHNFYGKAMLEKHRVQEAVSHFREAIRIRPSYLEPCIGIGRVLLIQGKVNEAIGCFNEVLRFEKNLPDVYVCLGRAYERLGRSEPAIEHLTRALELRPDDVDANGYLADALMHQGRPDEAAVHYRQALQNRPSGVEIMNNLAWILAVYKGGKSYNPDEATHLAEKACKLTGYKKANILDTLAAAYAAAGRFSEAVAAAEKALELVQSPEQAKLRDEIHGRIGLYKTNQPYIEPLPQVISE